MLSFADSVEFIGSLGGDDAARVRRLIQCRPGVIHQTIVSPRHKLKLPLPWLAVEKKAPGVLGVLLSCGAPDRFHQRLGRTAFQHAAAENEGACVAVFEANGRGGPLSRSGNRRETALSFALQASAATPTPLVDRWLDALAANPCPIAPGVGSHLVASALSRGPASLLPRLQAGGLDVASLDEASQSAIWGALVSARLMNMGIAPSQSPGDDDGSRRLSGWLHALVVAGLPCPPATLGYPAAGIERVVLQCIRSEVDAARASLALSRALPDPLLPRARLRL